MIAVQPTATTKTTWPQALTLAPYQQLQKFQIQKIAMVAIACLMLFGLQFACSLSVSLAITFACSTITLLSETFLRKNDPKNSNWLKHDFDKTLMMKQVAFCLILVPIVFGLSIAMGTAPMQNVVVQFMNRNVRMIFLATVSAPFAEEILFRGFFQERIEDAITLVGRVICPVSKAVKEYASLFLQAVVFGLVHIPGKQVVKAAHKIRVFIGITVAGLWFGWQKNRDKSLLSLVAIHASQNTGVVLGALGGAFFKERLVLQN
jgi:membrane protease YdiL (CAAX protease family)